MTVIEVWCEEAGKAIPRPPEGWDDLDIGGAERHGRWAWGDESPSEIENNVAARTPFFPPAEKRENMGTSFPFLEKIKNFDLAFDQHAVVAPRIVVCDLCGIVYGDEYPAVQWPLCALLVESTRQLRS